MDVEEQEVLFRDWESDPVAAFDQLVASRAFVELSLRRKKVDLSPLRASSATIYRLMWRNFLEWMAAERLTLSKVSPQHLATFLDRVDDNGARVLKSATIRRQYLTMWERVYKHIGVSTNPASLLCFEIARNRTTLVGDKSETVHLTDDQVDRLLDALPNHPKSETDPLDGWMVRRDTAMIALMLGAGLKVSEAIGLYTDHIGEMEDAGLPVVIAPASKRDTKLKHKSFVRPFAAPIVIAWVKERRSLRQLQGQLLFPGTTLGARLDKSTVYRHVKKAFAAAGIEVPKRGGRTLRNTFAVRELQAGEARKVVKELLGHRRDRSMETYLKVAGEG